MEPLKPKEGNIFIFFILFIPSILFSPSASIVPLIEFEFGFLLNISFSSFPFLIEEFCEKKYSFFSFLESY